MTVHWDDSTQQLHHSVHSTKIPHLFNYNDCMTEDGVQQKAMEGQKLWTITISTIEINENGVLFDWELLR
jgi:hypothetical protein